MVKEKKKDGTGEVIIKVLQGVLLTLAIYVLTSMLLTLLVIRGKINQTNVMPLLYAVCIVSAYFGGKWTSRKLTRKMKGYALLPSVIFCVCYVLFAFAFCEEGVGLEKIGLFMLCAFIGGCFAVRTGKELKKGKRLRK